LAKPPPLFPLFGKEGLGEILDFKAVAQQSNRRVSAAVRLFFIRNKFFFLNLTVALSHYYLLL